jgi:type II secretory pathway pseudopilin PulG
MKGRAYIPISKDRGLPTFCLAFTLPEVLISAVLFVLLLGGIIGANLFGLRMSQIAQTKLNVSDSARKAIGRMTDEIRGCNSTWVGNVSNGTFVALLDAEPQTGTGLMIQPSTNTANYVIYFLNPSDRSFRRTTSVAGTTTVLAQEVTNTSIFCAQDYLGNVLTNSQNNRVIHLRLEFFHSQPQLPEPDYYKLESSMTRRTLQ